MAGKSRPTYRVVAAYDTETCNIGTAPAVTAYPILYILNDFSDVPLADYTPDDPRECITFDRTPDAFLSRIADIIGRGLADGYIPIVCAYNLMFDMTTIMPTLAASFELAVSAQSSTNVYTIDVCDRDSGEVVLRFWDTFFLEQGGLRAMGETAGVAKATGDWDYSLTRTPETPLTDLELFYAKRDVQVIPAYLRYLLRANEWMSPEMLGVNVLTKTGTVRQMAKHTFGNIRITPKKTLIRSFEYLCKDELPTSYDSYALRKACFRGGFTFTSGVAAMRTLTGVLSTDVTSMHHTFINGRLIPVGFRPTSSATLTRYADMVLSVRPNAALHRYHQPFPCAFHARITFTNLRLRRGSAFDAWQIALIPRGKFSTNATGVDYWSDDPAAVEAENATRAHGWYDSAVSPTFAFGKLYNAKKATLHVSEVELWCIAQVYEWDDMRVECGEGTVRFVYPPNYVTLQSNLLFERKSDCKRMVKTYTTGVPYTDPIPDTIPAPIADEMRHGTLDAVFLNNYYNGTVKGMFNGIYGTQAQDVFKPDYMVLDSGDIVVDRSTVLTPDNFDARVPNNCRVLYTYGMRIVAGSRMHLVMAIMLLYARFGTTVTVSGGDTDSIKLAVPPSVSDDEVADALAPMLTAATNAIAYTMAPLRRAYPAFASSLDHVGGFEVENAGNRYEHHMEYWNKARVSEAGGVFHVTMAGLSRPMGCYHIERIMEDLYASGNSFDDVASLALGYNVTVAPEASFSVETVPPALGATVDADITDYLGRTAHVSAPAAIGIYEAPRALGDTSKLTNMENVRWLRAHGTDVPTEARTVRIIDGRPVVEGIEGILLEGVRHGA